MQNHLAVAQAFVQELQQTHQNIIGILLTGSVARRQAAPFSDVDLIIIVTENEDNQVDRSSSTRHLVQLAEFAPELAASISALEGATEMIKADVEAAYDIFAQLTSLGDTSRWGQLPIYMVRKVEWMIHHDMEYAAVHTMWNNVGFRINILTPSSPWYTIYRIPSSIQFQSF